MGKLKASRMETIVLDKFLKQVEGGDEKAILRLLNVLTAEEKQQLIHELFAVEKSQDETVQKWWHQQLIRFRDNKPYEWLKVARFFIYTKKDINQFKPSSFDFPSASQIDKLLDLYQPEWFTLHFTGLIERNEFDVGYFILMKWLRAGYIVQAPDSYIANTFVEAFYGNKEIDDPKMFLENLIDRYPESIHHVRLIFQYPCNIWYRDTYSKFNEKLSGRAITTFIKLCIEKGLLDRMDILRDSLVAMNRHFNKEQTGWYPDFFISMKPVKEELLLLQDELFHVLSSTHSKSVTTILRILKGICKEPGFRTDDFLLTLPVLLSSNVKSLVTAALSLTEQVAKEKKDRRNEICECLLAVFLNRDESLQVRTANIILRYGDKKLLESSVGMYTDAMFSTTKSLLSDMLSTSLNRSIPEQSEDASVGHSLTREDNRLAEIETIEELVFHLSRAFIKYDVFDIDLIPVALLRFRKEVTADVLLQMTPAIKECGKVFEKWSPTKHFQQEVLACYFIYFCRYRVKQLSAGCQNVKDASVEALKTGKSEMKVTPDKRMKKISGMLEKIEPVLEKWTDRIVTRDADLMYYPYIDKFETFKRLLVSEYEVPLLSTPTHTTGRIAPLMLVERCLKYMEANNMPTGLYDLQIAMLRCDLSDVTQTAGALRLAERNIAGYLGELFIYMFDKKQGLPLPENRNDKEYWWLTAAIARYEKEVPEQLQTNLYKGIPAELFTDGFRWEPAKRSIPKTRYNMDTKQWERYEEIYPAIYIDLPLLPADVVVRKKMAIAYNWIDIASYDAYNGYYQVDINGFIMLYPNHHEVLLARYIYHYVQYYEGKIDDQLLQVLNTLEQLGSPLKSMGHLYLALCLTINDKVTRSYAAASWAKMSTSWQINHTILGSALGRLIRNGNIPVKRFTDNILESMLNLSDFHNKVLEKMMVSLLEGLDEKPVLNLKKLLEIYNELLVLNHSKIDENVIPLLQIWIKEKSLEKIAGLILEH